MLAGGVLAAPVAAWVLRFLPPRGLGVAVGLVLFLTNIRELASAGGWGAMRWVGYALAALVCAYAAVRPRLNPELNGATASR
jgi:uncharacterized protein